MRVKLPSNGCMGVSSLEIRQPKVEDLRTVRDLPSCQALAKTIFVKRLLDDPDKLDKCSIYDKEYLFTIVAGAINLNKFDFEYVCGCGETVKSSFNLEVQEVIDLPKGVSPVYTKEISGKEYKFVIPTVSAETELCNFIIDNDLPFDEFYQDGLITLILGNPISFEELEKVKDLSVTVYYGAICFYQYAFHGVRGVTPCRCHKCGKETNVVVPIADKLLNVDMFALLRRFATLSKSVDFNSFKDLTIPELCSLEESFK